MSLFDVTPVYVSPNAGGMTPGQPAGGSLTPIYLQPDGSVAPSQPASWWQRMFGGEPPAYVSAPIPPSPSERRGCSDDGDGGVITKGRRRPRAETVAPSPFGTTPTE